MVNVEWNCNEDDEENKKKISALTFIGKYM